MLEESSSIKSWLLTIMLAMSCFVGSALSICESAVILFCAKDSSLFGAFPKKLQLSRSQTSKLRSNLQSISVSLLMFICSVGMGREALRSAFALCNVSCYSPRTRRYRDQSAGSSSKIDITRGSFALGDTRIIVSISARRDDLGGKHIAKYNLGDAQIQETPIVSMYCVFQSRKKHNNE